MTENQSSQKRTLILVDRSVSGGKWARDSFWPKVLPADSYDTVSISDSRAECRGKEDANAVRIDEAGLVIVNYDAANGEYVCGSDDVLMYFWARRDRVQALMRKEGTLLCELQAGKGVLSQVAYDGIFGAGNVWVYEPSTTQEARNSHGASAQVFELYRKHPIVDGLKEVTAEYRDEGDHIFNFAGADYESLGLYKDRESQLWRGWFRDWAKGWVSLLIAKSDGTDLKLHPSRMPRAVLLAKCESGGLLLASTMWIAGSRCEKLISNILLAKDDLAKIRKCHDVIRYWRWFGDAFWGVLLLGLIYLLWGTARAHLSPEALAFLKDNVILDIGRIWLIILGAKAFAELIWKRPYGVGALTNVWYGFWPFIKNAL